MIWRLDYANAHGDVARLEIQKGAATPVEIIEGTENPFLLSYELEDKSKKGFIMSSFADISIYETATFNIDDLKTSNETELSANWYINSVLEWTGFVVPDFFSRTIGEPAIVNLAASDRLSALKDITLDGLSEYITLRDLATACLAKTGLNLSLFTNVDFKANGTSIMNVLALSERIKDDKGKNISCYDVLRSILVLTNSTIRQRVGGWYIYNKIQHEAINPTLNFDEVHQGAKRTIQPVFSSVGAFQEFGGFRSSPENNSFDDGIANWTVANWFAVDFDSREVSYNSGSPVIIFGDDTDENKLINLNVSNNGTFATTPRLFSKDIKLPFTGGQATFDVVISSRGSGELQGIFYIEKKYVGKPSKFTSNGSLWTDTAVEVYTAYEVNQPFSDDVKEVNCVINLLEDEDPEKVAIVLHIGRVRAPFYTNPNDVPAGSGIAINSVKLINKTKNDAKGILYRTEQIGVFSKKNDPDTTIFGDHLTNGLNGYFYPFSRDDTSVLHLPTETKPPTTRWTTATDPAAGSLPLLQHVTKQISRMFGVAHDVLNAVLDVREFDPLAVVKNCKNERYVIVAATFDFLRSVVEVELQQIAHGSLERRDFIFSYFGGEEDGISSIGSASGGGGSSGGGGGGSFLDQYFTFDDENDALVANVNLVSEKELAINKTSVTSGYKLDVNGKVKTSNDVLVGNELQIEGGNLYLNYNKSGNSVKTSSIYGRNYAGNYKTTGLNLYSNSSNNYVRIGGGASGSYASTRISFYTASNTTTQTGSARAYIDNTKLHVNGNISATGNITAQGEVTAYSSSDIRLKQNIKPIENALGIISKLNPVAFNWNDKAIELNNSKDNNRINYGVIAQELEKILPELVHTTNDYKSVDYPQLIMILAKGIQELKLEVDELKNKLK